MLKHASISRIPYVEVTNAKVKVPNPKSFDVTQSAKELENFYWDMEQYFIAFCEPKDKKVMIACMCLAGDAKL